MVMGVDVPIPSSVMHSSMGSSGRVEHTLVRGGQGGGAVSGATAAEFLPHLVVPL